MGDGTFGADTYGWYESISACETAAYNLEPEVAKYQLEHKVQIRSHCVVHVVEIN
jgi:uncharacterized protein YjaG (DUF416 family)